MAPLALAPALLVPFAEAIGIVTAGLSLAALSDLVSDYMEDNPEKSEMILGMLNPAEGILSGGFNALFNKKGGGEEVEVSEEIKIKPKSKRSKKEIVLEALRKKKGNYASPDAEGNYADKRGRVIRGLADEGKITDKPDPNYDPSKKYQGYKKFFNKAEGGRIGYKDGTLIGDISEMDDAGIVQAFPYDSALVAPIDRTDDKIIKDYVTKLQKKHLSLADKREGAMNLENIKDAFNPIEMYKDYGRREEFLKNKKILKDGLEATKNDLEAREKFLKEFDLMIYTTDINTAKSNPFAQGGMAGTKTYHQYHDQYVPMDSESMMYANGGGVGSMMQPRQNYALAGFIEDESETFTPNNFGLQLNNDNVDNTQVAEVEPKDITASKMSGFKNQDYNSFKNQQDLFGGTKVTPFEFKGLQEGTITEPGTYKPTARLSNDEFLANNNLFANANTTMTDGNYMTKKNNYVSPTMDMKMNQSYKASPKDGIFKSLINNAMDSKPMRTLNSAYNLASDNVIGPLFAGVAGIANRYNPLREGSQNYNKDLKGQVNNLNERGMLGDQSSPYKITAGPLAGKNLVSGFGTNDYGQMLQKRIDYFRGFKNLTDSQYAKLHATIAAKKAADAAAAKNQTRQQSAIERERGTKGSSDYGNPGGTSGAMTSANQGTYCFDPSTPIQMADGSTKEIKNIQLGDDTKGGEVTGVFQFKATDEIHDYKGVTVAGSHYVKEDGKFIMVKDSPLSVKIDKIPSSLT